MNTSPAPSPLAIAQPLGPSIEGSSFEGIRRSGLLVPARTTSQESSGWPPRREDGCAACSLRGCEWALEERPGGRLGFSDDAYRQKAVLRLCRWAAPKLEPGRCGPLPCSPPCRNPDGGMAAASSGLRSGSPAARPARSLRNRAFDRARERRWRLDHLALEAAVPHQPRPVDGRCSRRRPNHRRL